MRRCIACGFENAVTAKFCAECGTALTASVTGRREERKIVSVVFVDLVGSTARAETSDPEDVRALLRVYHERARRELESFGGVVEKFIGDAVVAVFGAPVSHEDDPERAVRAALAGAVDYRRAMLRLFGMPESEIAATLRAAEQAGIALERLEVTTCLRRGEVEVVTRYEPQDAAVYEQLAALVRERHPDTLFSDDGTTVDQQVLSLLSGAGETIAVAESCTGGLLAARLTELPGSSAVMLGGLVVYSNDAKTALAGVDARLICVCGAVSGEVAAALADGARAALGADVGVGITGVAGPGGGSELKPVGTVWLSASHRDGRRLTRRLQLPGSRADVRDRSTTVAMHLVRRLLQGADDPAPAA